MAVLLLLRGRVVSQEGTYQHFIGVLVSYDIEFFSKTTASASIVSTVISEALTASF